MEAVDPGKCIEYSEDGVEKKNLIKDNQLKEA